MMYNRDFMTKSFSLYFMKIIDDLLNFFEYIDNYNDNYNDKYNDNERQKIKKYKLSFDDEFVML
jgi:hypothetical protein